MEGKMAKNSIALALSGGVDSAVCAYLLKQQGYKITAVYLECWDTPGCRAEKDRQDALQIALQLKIPFKVLDFKKEYQNQVMSYFLEEYKQGRTPNPDVLCNQVVKFGLFYDWAMANGYDTIATGHYAQIGLDQEKKSVLLTSEDLHKDQTYFLHLLEQKQLPHIIFPISHLKKTEVRDLAKKSNLSAANKKDSVGICFVGEINVHHFLEEQLGKNSGEVITSDGFVVGKHNGLWFYTVGQRKGFEINSKAIQQHTNWANKQGDLPPLFVINKDQQKNQLIIGPVLDTKQTSWQIYTPHWIDPDNHWENNELQVRIRHTGEIVPCKLKHYSDGVWQVTTQKPIQGIAPGQFSVFYERREKGDKNNLKSEQYACLGGGVIQ